MPSAPQSPTLACPHCPRLFVKKSGLGAHIHYYHPAHAPAVDPSRQSTFSANKKEEAMQAYERQTFKAIREDVQARLPSPEKVSQMAAETQKLNAPPPCAPAPCARRTGPCPRCKEHPIHPEPQYPEVCKFCLRFVT